jgi:hypothetical protein
MKGSEYTEYRDPMKITVGRANENAVFLKIGWRDPKAGAVMYWLPVGVYHLIEEK